MTSSTQRSTAAIAYKSALQTVAEVCPEVASLIVSELRDQRENLKLIASENFSSLAVQLAMGNLLTDKYAEGVPGAPPAPGMPDKDGRFYAGCHNVNEIERLGIKLACELFGAEHAYVQPHSGADANLVAFLAVLQKDVEMPELQALNLVTAKGAPDSGKIVNAAAKDWNAVREKFFGQRLLGLALSQGGHLTHGYRPNFSGKLFESHWIPVNPETGLIDYDALAVRANELKPRILLAGYPAYPRLLDFQRFREIAESCGARLVVDMAHFAGLVAGKALPEERFYPIPFADIVTSTTHKTLRGPRGGLILSTKEFATFVDKGCPNILGGPLPHIMAAKAVCFKEALSPSFKDYAAQIIVNARTLAESLAAPTIKVVTGGTDNHLVLLDITESGFTGRQAETALRDCGITLNRNMVPGDTRAPLVTSGLRLGTAAVTTLGMKGDEMREIAAIVKLVLGSMTASDGLVPPAIQDAAHRRVFELLRRHPLYPELDLQHADVMPVVAAN